MARNPYEITLVPIGKKGSPKKYLGPDILTPKSVKIERSRETKRSSSKPIRKTERSSSSSRKSEIEKFMKNPISVKHKDNDNDKEKNIAPPISKPLHAKIHTVHKSSYYGQILYFYRTYIGSFGLLLAIILLISHVFMPNIVKKIQVTHEIKQLKTTLDSIIEEIQNAEAACISATGDIFSLKHSLKDVVQGNVEEPYGNPQWSHVED